MRVAQGSSPRQHVPGSHSQKRLRFDQPEEEIGSVTLYLFIMFAGLLTFLSFTCFFEIFRQVFGAFDQPPLPLAIIVVSLW